MGWPGSPEMRTTWCPGCQRPLIPNSQVRILAHATYQANLILLSDSSGVPCLGVPDRGRNRGRITLGQKERVYSACLLRLSNKETLKFSEQQQQQSNIIQAPFGNMDIYIFFLFFFSLTSMRYTLLPS